MTTHIPSPAPSPRTHCSHPAPATSIPLRPRCPHLCHAVPSTQSGQERRRGGTRPLPTVLQWLPRHSEQEPKSQAWPPAPYRTCAATSQIPRHPALATRPLPCPGTYLVSPFQMATLAPSAQPLSRPYSPPPTAVLVVSVFISSSVCHPHQSVSAKGTGAFVFLASVFPASVTHSA